MSLTPQQVAVRQTGIGSSDAAAAVGLSRWKTPFELWQEKLGEVAPPDLSDNEAVRFGHLLEDVVAQEFARRQNVRVWRDRQTRYHRYHRFMLAHIDRRIVTHDEHRRAGLECKTTSLRMAREWGEEGTDQIPLDYLAQCLHALAVTGWDEWHVAVLIAGSDFRMYCIQRDEEAISHLIEQELYFWECVKTHVAPDPITLADAQTRWPFDTGRVVRASPEVHMTVEQLRVVRAEQQRLEKAEAELQLAVKAAMGDAATLLGPDSRPLATWRNQTTKRVDIPALRDAAPDLCQQFTRTTDCRVFRLK